MSLVNGLDYRTGPSSGWATGERFFTKWRIALASVFCLACVPYLGSLFGGPISDDYQHLSGSSIGGGTFLGAITAPFLGDYYRPGSSLSYLLDSWLWGSNPIFWHLTNIALHGLTAVLVAMLAWKVVQRKGAALWAGVFFALQPAQATAVAWIGGRPDVLSAFLVTTYLLALAGFLTSGRRGLLVTSGVLLFLACATKEQNFGYLLVAPILERVLGNHSRARALQVGGVALAAVVLFGAFWLKLHPPLQGMGAPGLAEIGRRVSLGYLNYFGLLVAPNPWALTCTTVLPYGLAWILPAAILIAATPWLIVRTYRFDARMGALLLSAVVVYLPVSNVLTIPSTPVAPYRIANVGLIVAVLLGWWFSLAIKGKRWIPKAVIGANLAASIVAVTWITPKMENGVRWWSTCLTYDADSRMAVKNAAAAFLAADEANRALNVIDGYLSWIYAGDSWRRYVDSSAPPPISASTRERFIATMGGAIDDEAVLAQLLNYRGAALAEMQDDKDALSSYLAAKGASPAHAFTQGIAEVSARLKR